MLWHSYTVYSAVFLHKAVVFGAISYDEEKDEVRNLVLAYILILEKAATNESHIGYRYSKLLKTLWFPDKTDLFREYRGKSGAIPQGNHHTVNVNASFSTDKIDHQAVHCDKYHIRNESRHQTGMTQPIIHGSNDLLDNLDPFCPWLMDVNTPVVEIGDLNLETNIGLDSWMSHFVNSL